MSKRTLHSNWIYVILWILLTKFNYFFDICNLAINRFDTVLSLPPLSSLLWFWRNIGLWKFYLAKLLLKKNCVSNYSEIAYYFFPSLYVCYPNNQTILLLLFFVKIFWSACFCKLSIKLVFSISSLSTSCISDYLKSIAFS